MRCTVLLFAAAGCLWLTQASAQSSVGGSSKPQNYLGGTVTHGNPVVPTRSASGGKITPANRQKK
jgi:hypothetical protein